MKKFVLVLLLTLSQLTVADTAAPIGSNFKLEMELTTVNGGKVSIPQKGPAHLVFIDNWASYGGHGPEAALQALPDSFRKTIPTIWFQPRLNVTDAHLLEYQKAFPASTPLVMDDHLQIMRKFSVKRTPAHILLEDGKVVFSGNTEAFLSHLGYQPNAAAVAESAVVNETENSGTQAGEKGSPKKLKHGVLSVNDIDNLNEFLYASGDSVQLIFLDDLCPTDHMPGCEKTVEKVSQNYRAGDHNWIVIYNGFYSNPSTSNAFSEKHNLTMPALFDEDHAIFNRYKVYSTPYFIELNKSGEVINRGSKVSTLTNSAGTLIK